MAPLHPIVVQFTLSIMVFLCLDQIFLWFGKVIKEERRVIGTRLSFGCFVFIVHRVIATFFYRTRVRSLGMLVTHSLTDSLTHSLRNV